MSREFFTGEVDWLTQLTAPKAIPGGIELSTKRGETLRIEHSLGSLRIRAHKGTKFVAPLMSFLAPSANEVGSESFEVVEDGASLILRSTRFLLRIECESGEITISTADHHGLCSGLKLGFTGCRPTVRTQLDENDRLHGTGLRSEPFNLRGRSSQIWTNNNPNPRHTRDSSYAVVPFVFVHRPKHGCYGLFYNNPSFAEIDLGERVWDQLAYQAWSGDVDLFLIPGPSPSAVLRGYTDLSGRLELPPRWVLGFGHSRYGMSSADDVVLRVIRYAERRLPLQWIAVDLDYMQRDTPWTWDEARFGPPGKLAQHLWRRGLALVTIMDPLVPCRPGYAPYDRMLKQGVFCLDGKGEKLAVVEGFAGPSHVPDLLHPETFTIYRALFTDAARSFGVGGFWLDKNELAMKRAPVVVGGSDASAQSASMGDVETLGGDDVIHHGGVKEWDVHNLFGLMFSKAAYQGQRHANPDARPFVLSRAHFAGSQVYACGWTGDNHADFGSLRNSIGQLLGLGVSGLPFYGMDIGGFFGHCTTELLVRWVQYGVFNPLSRIHSFRETVEQVPWHHGNDAREIIRRYLELRSRLSPLTNDLFWQAMTDGTPLMRPLLWDYWNEDLPEDPWIQFQYLWGPFLVAPVVDSGHVGKQVYLPGHGSVWYDFWTRRGYEGGRSYHVDSKLDILPLFIKAGSILPMIRPLQDLTTNDTDFFLFAYSGGSSSYLLHLDDGMTRKYKAGCYSTVTIDYSGNRLSGRLTIGQRQGEYEPPPRTITVRFFVVDKPSTVTLDGKPVHWAYHPENDGSIAVILEEDGASHVIEYGS